MRAGHVKLWGYPGLLLGVWLLSLVVMSGSAWFVQEWRYRDLATRTADDQDSNRPVYVSSGPMQVVNGSDSQVYMTADADEEEERATLERRWRDTHPVQSSVYGHVSPSGGYWGVSKSPAALPDFQPLDQSLE